MARCPFVCGKCCEKLWRGVACFEVLASVLPLDSPCPYQERSGCRLERDQRPPECGNYLCVRAESALLSNPMEVLQ